MGLNIGYKGEPTEVTEYDCCLYVDCPHCQGKGKVSFTTSGIHMGYSTWNAVRKELCLPWNNEECCGSMDPLVLLEALAIYEVPKDDEPVPYHDRLVKMCVGAIRAGQQLEWG